MGFEANVTERFRQLSLDDVYHPEHKTDFEGAVPGDIVWLDGDHYVLAGADGDRNSRDRVHAGTGDSAPLYRIDNMTEAMARIDGISGDEARNLALRTDLTMNPDRAALFVTHGSRLIRYRFRDDSTSIIAEGIDDPTGVATSPDGRSVSYTRGNDLAITNLDTGAERVLTVDGSGTVLNGRLDWVYQEEVYGRGDFKGHWWSPDSKHIALLQLDETGMEGHTIVDHISIQPKLEVTRYPRAGAPNPGVRLGILSLEDGIVRWIDTSGYARDHLMVRICWTPDSAALTYQVQNRTQTWLELNIFDLGNRESRMLLRETTPAWVSVTGQPVWCKDESLLWLSDRTGWRHIYRYGLDGDMSMRVTSGDWDVREIHGVATGWIYFSATEHDPKAIHVYKVRVDGTDMARLTDGKGTHKAAFSPDCTWFAETASTISRPPEVHLCSSNGTRLRKIAETTPGLLGGYEWGQADFMSIPSRDGVSLEVLRITPPGFDQSRRYPILCHTYGGPAASLVQDAWNSKLYLWHQVIAQQGYVIWVLDNRTASNNGATSAWPLYRNLGELELRDHEDSVDWLRAQPWVDPARIGIWGWSFGGYLTAYALTHSASFKMGIAGAPVTDWRLYDSIYTERYMDLPDNNPDGYLSSSVIEAAGALGGKLLILHGTLDDNVHIDHSLGLIEALQKAGKQFEVMFYPGSRHAVEDPHQNHHMRRLMMNFILKNL